MIVENTKLQDCFLIRPQVFKDERGYFFESFNRQKFEALTGANGNFVQDNQSCSKKGIIRGLHFQTGSSAQAKLVRVIEGEVLDVAVDLRSNSPTYLQWFSVKLNSENNFQLYIPRGFAHGFSVLSEMAVFAYKCDNVYDKSAEGGIRFDDPSLNIDWQLDLAQIQISEKDALLPFLNVSN